MQTVAGSTHRTQLRLFFLLTLLGCADPPKRASDDEERSSDRKRQPKTADSAAPETPSAAPSAAASEKAPSLDAKGKAGPGADPTKFPFGYYDVSGRGAARDFCQVNAEATVMTCDTGEKILRWEGKLDLGYEGTAQMKDVNGDGRDDFCRCVGDAPTIRVSCLIATPEGLSPNQYAFDPPARRDCDLLNAQATPAPTPAPIPITPPKTAEPPQSSSCTPGNLSACSCGAAQGKRLCQPNGRFGACDCSRLAQPSGPCTFGQQRSCGCPGGIQGVTVCNGKGWEPCAC